MPDLLLELRSEEIPARMQGDGIKALKQAVLKALGERDLAPKREDAETFATPRRLALILRGLPAASVARTEERRGPRVSAPESALAGFLRATGLERSALEVQGEGQAAAYVARLEHPGRPLVAHLTELLPEAIRAVRWPKSMRWNDSRFRWVRPLRGILALVGDADSCAVVPLALADIPCGAETRGHPFMAPGPIRIESIGQYVERLKSARVILQPDLRRERVEEGATAAAQALGLEVVPDAGLIDEIAGLTEWPVVLAGPVDDRFSELPDEILRASMRTHQKFLALRDGRGRVRGFAGCADTEAADGGALIRVGYARVLRARLEDARFFWENDCRTGLAAMAAGLDRMMFHAALGTMADRVKRIVNLSQELAEKTGANADLTARAAALAKADLNAGTVGEFPELQGLIGAQLARQAGEPAAVAEAIAGQYRPAGPAGKPVREPVAAALVLADRADLLWGFFAAGERPTGSRDPYALRRAALALLRTLLDNDLRITLDVLFTRAEHGFGDLELPMRADARSAVIAFTGERLRVHLRDTGLAAGVLAAAERGFEGVDPVRLRNRANAIAQFIDTDAGQDLVVAYRRTSGILEAEQQARDDTRVDPGLLREPVEERLVAAIEQAETVIHTAIHQSDDDDRALVALAGLREPVDAFFEQILVNAPEEEIRRNRLRLLARIRAVMDAVAAFGEIEPPFFGFDGAGATFDQAPFKDAD